MSLVIDSITIALPIYLELGKRKKRTFALNLNIYRNADFHTLNAAKVLFCDIVRKQIDHLPKMSKVQLSYTLFFGSRRAIDIANVCCIVDKFFCDTLVNCGKLPGDDKEIISEIAYRWGGVDTQNPRMEVTLSEIELVQESEKPMQISFTQDEIKDALLEALEKQISLQPGQRACIAFDLDDPKDIIAYIDITRDKAEIGAGTPVVTVTDTPAPVRAKPGPKPGSTRKAATASVNSAATTTGDETSKSGEDDAALNSAPNPVVAVTADEAKDLDAPFDTSAGSETPPQQAAISSGDERLDPAQEAPVQHDRVDSAPAGKSSIFPNAGSSAAQPSPVPSAAGPKSLFSNLVKPSNDKAATTH